MQKFAVINNKGGVGKSTTSVQIAHGLAKMGRKVLLIDLDDQNDSSMFLGITPEDFNNTLYEYVMDSEGIALKDCLINARNRLDLLPNSSYDKLNRYIGNERLPTRAFKKKLKPLEHMNYDFIIIDCAPTKNTVNDAVITYCDKIIMPVQVEAAAVRGAGNMYAYLLELDQPREKVALIIPNMYDSRTNESKDNLRILKKYFQDERGIVTEPVHRRVKITEAGKQGKTVFEYDEEAGRQFFKILEEVVSKVV